jgi:RNA polymerase sigma-70 factor (ECF subfamily)
MSASLLASTASATPSRPTPSAAPVERERRLAAFVRQHHAFVWRVLRRYGLSEADSDDGAQRVFMVLADRFEDVVEGSERAFLFRTAVHIASKTHRSRRRRPETPDSACAEGPASSPALDDLVDQRRARALLDQILEELPEDLRAVLILFEIEEFTTSEVADALAIPAGTVASRLRRARAALEGRLLRREAQFRTKGAPR